MFKIMGTSTCHIVLGTVEKIVPGMYGVVEDGVIPGYLCYEAGQSCVGDHFEWFAKNCIPSDLSKVKDEYYKPISENVEVYNKLFAEYKLLHDYFGRGTNNVMKRLKKLKLMLNNIKYFKKQ